MNSKVLEDIDLTPSILENSSISDFEMALDLGGVENKNHKEASSQIPFVNLTQGLDIEAIKSQNREEFIVVSAEPASQAETEVSLPPLKDFPLDERGRALTMSNTETTGTFSWPSGQDAGAVAGAKIEGASLSGHYSPDGVYMSGPMAATAAGHYGPGGAYSAGPMPATAAGHYGPGGVYSAGPMPSTTGFSSWGPVPTLMTGPGSVMPEAAASGAHPRPIMTGLPEGMHPLEIIQQRARQAVGQGPVPGQPQAQPQAQPQEPVQIIQEIVESMGQLARSGQLQLPAPAQQVSMDMATQAMRGAAIPDQEASFAWLASSVASGLASLAALIKSYQGVPEMQTALQDARMRVAQALVESGLVPGPPVQQVPQQPQQPQQAQEPQQAQHAQLVAATVNAAQTITQLAQAVSNVVAQQPTPQGQQVAMVLQQAAQQAQQAAQQAQQAAQHGDVQSIQEASQQAQQLLDQARQLAGQMQQ